MVEYFKKCGCIKCKKLSRITDKNNVFKKSVEVGSYMPITIDKKLMWDVKTGKESGFICERQEDAEILSWLVEIGKKLGVEEEW